MEWFLILFLIGVALFIAWLFISSNKKLNNKLTSYFVKTAKAIIVEKVGNSELHSEDKIMTVKDSSGVKYHYLVDEGVRIQLIPNDMFIMSKNGKKVVFLEKTQKVYIPFNPNSTNSKEISQLLADLEEIKEFEINDAREMEILYKQKSKWDELFPILSILIGGIVLTLLISVVIKPVSQVASSMEIVNNNIPAFTSAMNRVAQAIEQSNINETISKIPITTATAP